MSSPARQVAESLHTPSPRTAAPASNANWMLRARELVDDLNQRSPAIYWADFLLSVGAAWALASFYLGRPGIDGFGLLALLGASILFFRAGTFIHEIVHFRAGEMPWFGRVWNLLLGIPLLMPWIMYRNHGDHHNVRYFGTPEDGEYLPLASAPLRETLKYLLQAPLLPLLTTLRFGVLGPLSWFHRGLREWVLTAATHGVINPYYRRRFPTADERHLVFVEALCFLWLLSLLGLALAGVIAWVTWAKGLLLVGVTLALNWVRNLAAHGYGNRGNRMTLTEQFSDSINITGQTWLTALLFPVGLRYHALHHLLPTLPYHNMGKAHRRLTAQLPPDSPYHAASCDSFFAAAGALLRGAARTAPADSAIPRWRMGNAAT